MKGLFEIEHLDSLGQGVSKRGDGVCFIHKTLPGEKGVMRIERRKKGVFFGNPLSFQTVSKKRIPASCIHYDRCTGCHYLHCSYEDEIRFKKESLCRWLAPLKVNCPVHVIPSKKRDGYRNRIRLHRDSFSGKIGLKSSLTGDIIPIPECRLMLPSLAKEVKKRLKENDIQNMEYILHKDKVDKKTSFEQVNPSMNKILRREVNRLLPSTPLLELFAGNGNLTGSHQKEVHCLDRYTKEKREGNRFFIPLDVYGKNSLKHYLKKGFSSVETLLLNPPRSGFSLLSHWTKRLGVRKVIYVSCHPATLVSDLMKLGGRIDYVCLVDMFPSTRHFETIILLSLD